MLWEGWRPLWACYLPVFFKTFLCSDLKKFGLWHVFDCWLPAVFLRGVTWCCFWGRQQEVSSRKHVKVQTFLLVWTQESVNNHIWQSINWQWILVFFHPPALSSATPELTSAPATSQQDQAANEAQASASVTLDPSQPVTNIQIRLADGSKLVQKFNHTHRWLFGSF